MRGTRFQNYLSLLPILFFKVASWARSSCSSTATVLLYIDAQQLYMPSSYYTVLRHKPPPLEQVSRHSAWQDTGGGPGEDQEQRGDVQCDMRT